eukprot:Gb_14949 [translate_table: standard]
MYAKCMDIESARQVFGKMSKRDVVSWNALIGGNTQNGHAHEALRLIHQMQVPNAKPNQVTIVSVLLAYADLADLQQAKSIHDYIFENGFESHMSVGTALGRKQSRNTLPTLINERRMCRKFEHIVTENK